MVIGLSREGGQMAVLPKIEKSILLPFGRFTAGVKTDSSGERPLNTTRLPSSSER